MEQRKFQRFPLQSQLKVRGENQAGHSFCESTELINISGGGALFYSLQADQYREGQVIEANIMLPGTPEIRGRMKATATVVSVQEMRDSSSMTGSGRIQIAVHFLEPFRLLRDSAPLGPENQPAMEA